MKKTYHHGDLRTSAIKKTIELIEQRREADFTLREISQLLDVSHTAIYRHFSSKQMLLMAIATEGFKELNQIFQKAPSLHAICEAYIIFAYKNQGQFRSMFHQELRCGAELDESLSNESEKCYQYLKDAIHSSHLKHFEKVELEVATKSVWASIHGFSQLLIDGQFADLTHISKIKNAIAIHLQLTGIKINGSSVLRG